MKLLVNKNCSGYHWFECNLTGDDQYIKMYEAQSVNKVSSFLSGLRVYGQFDYCLIKDNKEYLLAINNIHEKERDVFNRLTSIKLIFVGNKDEAKLLLKILLTSLEDFNTFSTITNSYFASKSTSDPMYVRCNWEKLQKLIQEIDQKELNPKAEKLLTNATLPLIIVSPENSIAMGKNGLGFSDKEIKKAKEALRSIEPFFKTPSINNPENEDLSENKPEPDTNTGSTSGTATINDDNSDSDKRRRETVIDDSADRYSELQRETDGLRTEISLLKKDNKRLEDLLYATKQKHIHDMTYSQKKLRCYKGLIAASGAVIIALIILYIFK